MKRFVTLETKYSYIHFEVSKVAETQNNHFYFIFYSRFFFVKFFIL